MGYVTIEFYKNTFHGNSIPDDNLQNMLDRASTDIDMLTRMKIKKFGGFDKLSEFEQHQVQMAACHQAEYVYTKASMKGLSSYSIGDVSVSFDISKEYDEKCVMYLNTTNLMYRGL